MKKINKQLYKININPYKILIINGNKINYNYNDNITTTINIIGKIVISNEENLLYRELVVINLLFEKNILKKIFFNCM